MLFRELLGVSGVPAESHNDSFLQARIREGSQELSHGSNAYVPNLPVLALDSGLLTVLFEDEVDAAIRVCAATPSDAVAELAISRCDNLLKLEPVDCAKPLDKEWKPCCLWRAGRVCGQLAGILRRVSWQR